MRLTAALLSLVTTAVLGGGSRIRNRRRASR